MLRLSSPSLQSLVLLHNGEPDPIIDSGIVLSPRNSLLVLERNMSAYILSSEIAMRRAIIAFRVSGPTFSHLPDVHESVERHSLGRQG